MGEWRYSSTILDLGIRWSCQLHTLAALPLRKEPRYPLEARLGGPQSRSERYGVEKYHLPLTEVEP
jgi:hypothetical protein